MSKEKCPYIQKCKQQIRKEDLGICLGELEEWDYDDCLKFRDMGNEIIRKTPKEWFILKGEK